MEGGDKSVSEDVVLELAKPTLCLSNVYAPSNLHAGLCETRTNAWGTVRRRNNSQIFSKQNVEKDEADRRSRHGLLAVTSHDLKGAYILSCEQECREMMNTGRKGNRMKAKEKSRQLKKMTESNENM